MQAHVLLIRMRTRKICIMEFSENARSRQPDLSGLNLDSLRYS